MPIVSLQYQLAQRAPGLTALSENAVGKVGMLTRDEAGVQVHDRLC